MSVGSGSRAIVGDGERIGSTAPKLARISLGDDTQRLRVRETKASEDTHGGLYIKVRMPYSVITG